MVGLVTETIGAVVSLTVTVNDATPMLPIASVAEQLTVVVDIGNIEPEDGEQVGVIEPSTLSVAVAVYVAIAPDGPVASIVILAGTVTTGGMESTVVNFMVKLITAEAGEVFPVLSVAFAVML